MNTWWTAAHTIGVCLIIIGALYTLAFVTRRTAGKSFGWVALALLEIGIGIILLTVTPK